MNPPHSKGKLFFILVAIVAIATLTKPTLAENWVYVGEDKGPYNETQYFVDTDSIVKKDELVQYKAKRASKMFLGQTVVNSEDVVDTLISDCKTNEIQVLKIERPKNYEIIEDNRLKAKWISALTEYVGSEIHHFACH